jgi:peptide/nickel transport system ATP-binding protein
MSTILKVTGLTKHFAGNKHGLFGKADVIHAVDGLSFELAQGEALGLVGESGCGKSTTGRLITRLLEPTSGKIEFEGQDITHLSNNDLRPIRTQLQMIFQDPYSSLNPRHTVGTIIGTPFKISKVTPEGGVKKRVQELLEIVGLNPEHYNRYPHEFSGGQRQRVCIARALALSPELIVCDESVSALDVSVQAQVLNLLNELKLEFGFTYIFISHDLSVVRFMSDRIVVMKDGKIEEIGDADEVYAHPGSDYTKNLIDAIPDFGSH